MAQFPTPSFGTHFQRSPLALTLVGSEVLKLAGDADPGLRAQRTSQAASVSCPYGGARQMPVNSVLAPWSPGIWARLSRGSFLYMWVELPGKTEDAQLNVNSR